MPENWERRWLRCVSSRVIRTLNNSSVGIIGSMLPRCMLSISSIMVMFMIME